MTAEQAKALRDKAEQHKQVAARTREALLGLLVELGELKRMLGGETAEPSTRPARPKR